MYLVKDRCVCGSVFEGTEPNTGRLFAGCDLYRCYNSWKKKHEDCKPTRGNVFIHLDETKVIDSNEISVIQKSESQFSPTGAGMTYYYINLKLKTKCYEYIAGIKVDYINLHFESKEERDKEYSRIESYLVEV